MPPTMTAAPTRSRSSSQNPKEHILPQAIANSRRKLPAMGMYGRYSHTPPSIPEMVQDKILAVAGAASSLLGWLDGFNTHGSFSRRRNFPYPDMYPGFDSLSSSDRQDNGGEKDNREQKPSKNRGPKNQRPGSKNRKNNRLQQILDAAMDPWSKPDKPTANEIAARSNVEQQNRILNANLQPSKELVGEIESIFNNSLDPEVNKNVAEMNNRALPEEGVLIEKQMLFPDRRHERGREKDL